MILFERKDLHTVEEVRRMRRLSSTGSTNWREIARSLAKRRGRFVVWRCDDTVVVYTADPSHKTGVRQQSIKPGSWRLTS